MAVSISVVNVAANDTFGVWVTRTNEVIDALATVVVTANSDANGSLTSGNAWVNGIFSANLLAAFSGIRGGNVQVANTLILLSNLNFNGMLLSGNSGASISIGNSTINLQGNSTVFSTPRINVAANSIAGFAANSTALFLNGKSYGNLDPHIMVANNGVNVGDIPRINFIASGGIAVNTTLDGSSVNVALSVSLSSIGAAGANTEVQFNDSGIANGVSGLTFDKTTNNFSVGNTTNMTNLRYPQAMTNTIFANSATTSEIVLDSFLLADYRGAEYCLTVKDNTANAYQIVKLLVLHSLGSAFLTEFGTISTNTDIATFTTSVNSTHLLLNYTGATNNTSVKGTRTFISV